MTRRLDHLATRTQRNVCLPHILMAVVLVAGFQSGCGSGAPNETRTPSTGDTALDAALAKEVRLDGDFLVEPASKSFTATAMLPPILSIDEGIEEIVMQLPDAGGDISCFVYKEEGDVGGAAVRLGIAGIELIEREFGNFEVKRINGFYADVAGGVAYHGVEWLLASSGGSAQPKAISANKHGRGLACLHFDLGYRQTFERVFRGLLESFSDETPPPAPYYSEVIVSKLGDLKVGIESTRLTLDQDGDTEIRTASSLLIPVSASELATTTSSGRSWSRPNGTLINAHVTEGDEADDHTSLNLKWVDDEAWRVSGTFQGKELDSLLPHIEPIDTKLREFIVLTSVLKPKGDQSNAVMTEWVPNIDPTDVIQSKITTRAGNPLAVRIEAAGISFDLIRGEAGLIESAAFGIGSATLDMKVIYREGGL